MEPVGPLLQLDVILVVLVGFGYEMGDGLAHERDAVVDLLIHVLYLG